MNKQHLNMQNLSEQQQGFSLMEMLIAMLISLIVSLAMISLMANTMGTGSRTIKMTKLSAEIRTAMHIISRDLRRANYHGNFVACFSNADCRSSIENGNQDGSAFIKPITVSGGNCVFFWLDRDSDGVVNGDDAAGAFRLATVNSVGQLQMTTTLTGAPDCNADANWTAITDPDLIDVTTFVVNNNATYTDNLTATASQTIDKIRVRIGAQLVTDGTVSRVVEDVIRVRNDIYAVIP